MYILFQISRNVLYEYDVKSGFNISGKDSVPFRRSLENALLFRLGIAGDPDCGHEDNYHDDTEFPELIATKQVDNRKACERQKTKEIPDDVSGLGHPAMPGIPRAKLFRRGDVE